MIVYKNCFFKITIDKKKPQRKNVIKPVVAPIVTIDTI